MISVSGTKSTKSTKSIFSPGRILLHRHKKHKCLGACAFCALNAVCSIGKCSKEFFMLVANQHDGIPVEASLRAGN
jgi:hypothetical protein